MKELAVELKNAPMCMVCDTVFEIEEAINKMCREMSSENNNDTHVMISGGDLYLYDDEVKEGGIVSLEESYCIEDFQEYFKDSKIYVIVNRDHIFEDDGDFGFSIDIKNQTEFDIVYQKDTKKRKVSIAEMLFNELCGLPTPVLVEFFKEGFIRASDDYCVYYIKKTNYDVGGYIVVRKNDWVLPESSIINFKESGDNWKNLLETSVSVCTFPDFKILKDCRG